MDKTPEHSTQPARFGSKRIFFQSSIDGKNTGWFISITSQRSYGPFPDKAVAQYILDGLVKRIKARQMKNHDSDSSNQTMSTA